MALDNFNPYLFVSAGEQSNKFLTPVISPEGIAAFQAQRAQDLSGLTIRINPIQEGTGDPSTTNVRPISGRTGMTVTRAGKNLLYTDVNQYSINGITMVRNADGTYTLNGTATAQSDIYFNNANIVVPNGEYLYNGITGGSMQTYRIYLSIQGKNGTRYIGTNDGDASVTLTDETIRSFVRIFNGAVLNNVVIKPMIRPANITDGTYVPYAATEYPITWESIAGTVYGGTLDVVSGVLTVTHKLWTSDGNVDWAVSGSGDNISFYTGVGYDFDVKVNDDNGYSNYFPYRYSFGTRGTIFAYTNRININPGSGFTSVEELKAAFAQTPLQLVYPLATPQTYQLTPTEVRTIAGYNQVYSDAGPVIDIKF